jgi:cell division protein FtsQ
MTARRRKPSTVARIRPFWMPITLAGALLVAALAVAATWPGFDAKKIEIRGNRRVSSAEILAHAKILRTRSIWIQNTGAIAGRIQAIPYIARVWILRIPPSAIRITVTEREPFAVLQSLPESVVVDRGLRVLMTATGDDRRAIFILKPGLELSPGTFVTARDALTLRDAYDALAQRQIVPLTLALDRYGGLVVTLRDGMKLLFGEGDLPEKLTLVDAILSQVVHRQRRVEAIDVRAPGTPVVVYR